MRTGLAIALAFAAACGGGGHSATQDAGGTSDGDATHDAPPASDARPPLDAPPAPTDEPAVPCTGSAGDVYATTPSASAAHGAILACAVDSTLDEPTVQTGIGSAMTATTPVATFLVAYATRGGDGSPAVTTARVYLPHVPRAYPVPLAVVGHGSVGIADGCVPSVAVDDNLPLPFAGRGFATIAPDLAGLGNAGTQDYLDNRAQGWQLLDGARALRALLAPGATAPQFVLSGYSQGGGAALSAQALARADGSDLGQLVATAVYAPEWPIRLNSFGYADILNDPTQLTIATGLSRSSIAVIREYSYFENWVGPGHGVDALPAQFRDAASAAIQDLCLVELGGYVQGQMLHTGDLIDDTLRQGLVACIAGNGTGAACTGTAQAFYDFMVANVVPPDPQAGPVLITQGLADQIMAPANEAACIDQELVGDGVDTSTCVLPFADHSNIMDNHALGETWLESIVDGGPRAQCDQTFALPACQP
jgi:hypothetical protein|nr:hypothetical protein [Kofleriaceae bacterium]